VDQGRYDISCVSLELVQKDREPAVPEGLTIDIELQGGLLVVTATGRLAFDAAWRLLKQVFETAAEKQVNEILVNTLMRPSLDRGGAQATTDSEVSDPAGGTQHHADSELHRIIAQQKMKFLQTRAFKRELVAQGYGYEKYPEAKEPPLQAEKASGAVKRS
jgi:hypothetical protein